MGKGAKGLDAQGSTPTECAIAQFPNRQPPALRSKTGLGARGDFHALRYGQAAALWLKAEVDSELFAMIGCGVSDDDYAGEGTVQAVRACDGLSLVCRNGKINLR
jgi:hypothetical protein